MRPIVHNSANVAFGFCVFKRLTFIVLLPPDADAEFDFRVSAGKVNLKRNERCTRRLCGFVQLFEFLLMNEQFSGSTGLMIKLMSLVVFRDVTVYKPQFAVFHSGVGIRYIAMPVSEAFDLASPQDDSALQLRRDVKVMPGAAVLCNVLESGIFGRSLFFLLQGVPDKKLPL